LTSLSSDRLLLVKGLLSGSDNFVAFIQSCGINIPDFCIAITEDMLIADKQIAIVGGGPGGLTLARLLQLKGANVRKGF
jgi:NADPH-dependent 2,4-dienoyl-CoA reductase/sulfur reductase-like enzyme